MDYNIASILKQLRKTSRLSAKETAKQLQEYGINISSKTIYGYESGLSMPNANVFVALCKIYRCDNPMNMFETTSYTPEEITFLKDFRQLDAKGQETLRYMLDHEKQRIQQIKELEHQLQDLRKRNQNQALP